MRVYPYGYGGKFKTEAEYDVWSVWLAFDPEYARRVRAAMEYGHDHGHVVGVGGGIRSTIGQLSLFLSRHHLVTSGGCCTYNGSRYALNAGAAHAAPPGRSYHEETTPDKKCLAADMIGDLAWINPQLDKFGLKHFGAVNGEPWHWQVVELPNSRANYDPAKHHPLPVFPLPGTPVPPDPTPSEDDMPALAHPQRFDLGIVKAGTVVTQAFMATEVGVNITVSGATANGFLVAWGADPMPPTSNVNIAKDHAMSNYAQVALDNGVMRLCPSQDCRIIIDLQAAK